MKLRRKDVRKVNTNIRCVSDGYTLTCKVARNVRHVTHISLYSLVRNQVGPVRYAQFG